MARSISKIACNNGYFQGNVGEFENNKVDYFFVHFDPTGFFVTNLHFRLVKWDSGAQTFTRVPGFGSDQPMNPENWFEPRFYHGDIGLRNVDTTDQWCVQLVREENTGLNDPNNWALCNYILVENGGKKVLEFVNSPQSGFWVVTPPP